MTTLQGPPREREETTEDRPVRRRRGLFEIISLVLAAGMAVLFLYPVVNVAVGAVFVDGRFSPDGFINALSSPELPGVLTNTVIVMVCAGTASVVIGTVFAWLNERTDARLGFLGTLLPLVPLMLPPVALSIGWFFLAQPSTGYLNVLIRTLSPWHDVDGTGPLNIGTWPGLVWVYTLHLVPFAYLAVSAAFRNVDPALEEASRVSGSGLLRTLWKVSLPAVRPAIGAAFLLVSLSSIALYSIPTIIGTTARIEVLSVHIVRLVRLTFPSRIYEGVVLSFVMMAMLLVVWFIQQRLSGNGRHSRIGGKATQATLVRLGPWKWVARVFMIGYLVAASLLPLAALLLVSLSPYWSTNISLDSLGFGNFVELWTRNVNARNALTTSLVLGLVGATLGMAIAAIMMTQAQNSSGGVRRFLEGVTKSPGAISNIIIGVAFLITYSGAPFHLYGTVLILLLAYLVIYLPQASVQASTAIQQIGPELMEASAMSGASRGRTFWRISFPLMLPGLAAGWAMLFVLMVGDLTASALLAGTRNPVVGFVILGIFENGALTQLAALAVIICVISSVVVGLVLTLAGRGRSAKRRRRRFAAPVTAVSR